MQLNIKYVIWY